MKTLILNSSIVPIEMITEPQAVISFRQFESLPDEILYDIIQQSGVDPYTFRLVSRQFKALVQQLPAFWTTIRWGNGASFDHLKRSLEFSMDCLLDVDLTVRSNTDIERLLQALPRQRWNRIRSLKINYAYKQRKALWIHLGGIQLSQLRRLELDCCYHPDTPSRPDLHLFYTHWIAPRLSSMRIVDELVYPISGTVLRELDVELCCYLWPIYQCNALLAVTPTLERLSVDISHPLFYEEVDEKDDLRPIELEIGNLKSVKYAFRTNNIGSFPETPQLPFIDNLVFPNVESFVLDVEDYDEDLEYLSRTLIDPRGYVPRYQNVVTLDFKFGSSYDINFVFTVVSSFPSLRHLALDISRGWFSRTDVIEQLVVHQPFLRLETVHIQDIESLVPNYFFDLAVPKLLDHWEKIT